MAVPIVESSTSTTFAASSSVVITKPAGLQVGELLLAYIFSFDNGTATSLSAPAGWSAIASVNVDDSFRPFVAFCKVATSTETAASSFTFNASYSGVIGGGMLRISGAANGSEFQTSEVDNYSGAATTSISFTAASTPSYTDSLVVMALVAYVGTGASTVSGYTTTPSKTWTEVFDIGNTIGSDGVMGVAYATSSSTSQITNYGATLSVAKELQGGILIIITAPQNASGSNTLVTTTSQAFAQSGTSDTVTSNTLATATATTLAQSGVGTEPTVWTLTAKP